MGLLDRALNFAQKAYNYVVGSDNDNKSEAAAKTGRKGAVTNPNNTNVKSQKAPNSAVNPEGKTVGTIGDVVEKSKKKNVTNNKTEKVVPMQKKVKISKKHNNNSENDITRLNNEIEKVKVSIEDKCRKFGISYKEAESAILSQMEFTFDEFKTLSPEEKLALLLSIDGALGLYIIQSKRKIHSTADKASVIGQTARNIIEAKEAGGVEDIKTFNDKVGDINKELQGKVNENTTDEEYAELLEKSRKSFRASLELERIAEIKKCNGDQAKIDEINKRYNARLHAFEAQRQVDFAAALGAKKANVSIYLRSGSDFSDAHAVALSLYTGEQRIAVANSFTHDFEVNAKRRYYEAGDAVSSEEYGKAVLYATQYMSADALNQFMKDAFEFRQKVEDGEIEAPYMTKDDFTQESASIGISVVNNSNLTNHQKQFLLSKWKNLISYSKDYKQVLKASAPQLESFDSSVTEILKILDNVQPEQCDSAQKIIEEIGDKKATKEQLERALTVMSFDKAKKQFAKNTDREFVEVILHSPKLKNLRPNILGDLKMFSPEELNDMTNGCSTDTFLFVLRSISPDKAGCLYDLSKAKKCYDARKLGKEIIEEGNKNAVA